MHIHLDLIGGIAGDMFSAALLDLMPELESPLLSILKELQLDTNVQVNVQHHEDKGLNGKRFNVTLLDIALHAHDKSSHDHSHQQHSHHHHEWKTIRHFITESPLEESVKINALGIFELLAEAEAKIHNSHIDNVVFHEVGAWDCIIDIISASWLICHSEANSWSVSDLPWGGGTVNCVHGEIPVPAPATVNLLTGFHFIDDGIKGERITPTGAAILSWLSPTQTVSTGTLHTSGYGFGIRKLPGRANVLRAILIEPKSILNSEHITTIQCDIDDMTNEMLAIAREKIRQFPGVLEITEAMSHGKKNRFINTLTILCEPSNTQATIDAVLNNTSSLGVRYWTCNRVILKRFSDEIPFNNQHFKVKTTCRPDKSISSKIEAEHLALMNENYQKQKQLKNTIEQQAEENYHAK